MKAAEFDYFKAKDLDEVCATLADTSRETRIIAGGQTLVPMMAMRLVRPDLLVDINDVDALVGIARDGTALVIRAGTRQVAAEQSMLVRQHLPLLAAALPWVGHQQTRNRGTVGGSLANADPSAEIPLVAQTLGAEVALRSQTGTRRLTVAEFLIAPMETAIGADEILTEIRFPIPEDANRLGVGFEEINTRASDFAILAAAAEVVIDSMGICRRAAFGIGGATALPMRAAIVEVELLGTDLNDLHIAHAVARISDALEPSSDIHAGAQYKRRLAPELLSRAIRTARDAATRGN